MKIRTKTFITVVLTILVLIWVLYATSTNIIRAGFSEIEDQTARANVDRATQGIWDQARNLGRSIRDWSYWDESYQFIQDNNPEFANKNLVDNVFTSLNINILIFIKPDGEILYSRAYDFQNKLSLPIPLDLEAHLKANQVLWRHTDPQKIYKGLILLPSNTNKLLLASSPILDSKGESPIAGTLIMGRYLNQPILDELAANQQLSLSLFRVDDPQLPQDFQGTRNKLVANQQINYEFTVLGGTEDKEISLEDKNRELAALPVSIMNRDTVAAYSLLRDIYGRPAMLLRADIPRTVYRQGERSLKFFFLFLGITSLVFGITTILLLERIVLARLAKLNQQVKVITQNSSLDLRIKLQGNDELGSLAQGINTMLNALSQSQSQQQESQERYQKVVEQASEGIFLINAQTKQIIEANSAFCNLLGYSQAQILNLTVYDLTNSDRLEVDRSLDILSQSQYLSLGERLYRRGDGSLVDVEVNANVISVGNQEVFCIVVRDISERQLALRQRQQMEDSLRQSEASFRGMVEQASVGIAFRTVDQGDTLLVNQKYCDILGYSQDELMQLNFRDITHPEDLELAEVEGEKILRGESNSFTIEKRYLKKDGSTVWGDLTVSLVRDGEGNPQNTIAILADITSRKRAEQALQENELLLRAIIDQAAVGISYNSLDGLPLLSNRKICDILGYSAAELAALNYRDYTYPQDLTKDDQGMQQLIAGEIPVFVIEKRYVHKLGHVVWASLNVSLVRDEAGEPRYTVVITQDISDRKRMETELEESQIRLRATFEQASVGIAYEKFGNKALLCNQKYCEILGYSQEELLTIDYRQRTHPEDLTIDEEYTKQLIAGEIDTFDIEKRYIRKDKSVVWTNLSLSLVRDENGEPDYAIVVVQDISDRKRIEEELRESQVRLQLTFEQAAVGIAQGELNGSQILFNQKYCDIVGYTPEELQHINYLEMTHPEDRDLDVNATNQLLAGEISTFTIEKRYIHKQGYPVWVSLTVSLVRDERGNSLYNIAVVQDISDRKKFEQQVKESEERFRAIASATPIPVFISELPSGRIVYINEAIKPMLGMTTAELMGNTTEGFYLNPSDRAHVLQKLQEQGYIHNYELQIRNKSGQGIWVITSSRVLSFDDKPAVLSVLYDITERKWAEEAIRQAEEKYRSIFENATDGIYQTSLSGDLFNANPALAEMFGYDLAPELIYDFTEEEVRIYVDNNRRREFLDLMQQQGTVLKFESQVQHRNGTIIWVSENAHTVYDQQGQPQFYEGMMVDITERKWAETQVNLLQSIILKISELEDVESALEVVLEEICQLRGWEYAEAWLPDPFRGVLQCSQAWYSSSPELAEFRRVSEKLTFAKGVGLPGRVWQTQAHEWQQDVGQLSAEQFKRHELIRDYHLGGLGVPIITNRGSQETSGQEEVLAVLAFFIFDAGEEDERLVQLILAIAAQLGTVIARKQAEAALREAEERYRSIFENASEGIFQSTLEGAYLSVNPALARIYGYESIDELINSIQSITRQIYVDPQRRHEFIAEMNRYNKVSQFESQVYRQDGTMIWVSENARAVRDPQGNLLYYEGTVVDITAWKIAEKSLRYEQEQSERLLLNILPFPIAQRLKRNEETIADYFPDVTVLFADLVGFTEIAAQTEAVELVKLLNGIFSAFDALSEHHRLEKIKTIGDAYMVVGGLPRHRNDHAEAIANMAIDMLLAVAEYNRVNGSRLSMRVGINTGAVVAGVIGTKKFIYDLWGDTVNTASRMESQGLPGCIQVTSQTYEVLKDKYVFEYRGTLKIKGKGEMDTYLLQGIKAPLLV